MTYESKQEKNVLFLYNHSFVTLKFSNFFKLDKGMQILSHLFNQ